MTSFPPEVKARIALCCAKSDATNLALVHSFFQESAERAIYHSIVVSPAESQVEHSNRALLSLISSPRRRDYVRELSVTLFTCMSDNDIGNSLKTSYLLFKSLENMNGLTQLRIRIYYDVPEAEGSARQLNEILCDPGALREMHTLFMTCCWECMDIPAIIKARPKLQNLGLYGTMGTRCGVDALEKLRQEGVTHLPLTFELRIWAYTSALDQLAFAPWFHVDSDPKEILHRVRSLLGDHRRATHPETFIDINHAVLYWKDAGSGHLAGQYEEILKDYFPRAEILVQSIYDQTHNY